MSNTPETIFSLVDFAAGFRAPRRKTMPSTATASPRPSGFRFEGEFCAGKTLIEPEGASRGAGFDTYAKPRKIDVYFPSQAPVFVWRSFNAEVAELADAHGSGPCTRKGVGVRVPSSAPVLFSSIT
jgi:hypothetical protein